MSNTFTNITDGTAINISEPPYSSNSTYIFTYNPPTYNCTKCKQEFKGPETIDISEFPGERSIHYKGPEFTRHICSDCYCKAMDKLFGIDSEAEFTLYK